MKIADIVGAKIKHGNNIYEMTEAKYGSVKVWPTAPPAVISYVIRSVSVYYSAGNMLYASGSNYAYFTGSVQEYRNGSAYGNPFTAILTPTSIAQSNPRVTISGDYVYGNDLAFDTYSQTTWTVYLSYNNATSSANVTQESNARTVISTTATGSKHYGQAQTSYSNYQISFSSNRYYHSTASDEAPAWGTNYNTEATLTFSANHLEVDSTPWTQDATVTYSMTSRPGQTFTQVISDYYSGEDSTRTEWVSDSLYDITGSASGFTLSGMRVSVDTEETHEYTNGRSVTYTARVLKHDGTFATASITIYQAKNVIVRTYYTEQVISHSESYGHYAFTVDLQDGYSVASAAPASGITTGLTVDPVRSHTMQDTILVTPMNVWSSESESEGTPYTTTSTSTTQEHGTATITIPQEAQSWLTLSGDNLTIASEGTTEYNTGSGYGRRALITASCGGDTYQFYVYQEINRVEQTTLSNYDIQCSMSGSGTIPTSGGQYDIYYTSQATRSTYYTSLAHTDKTVDLTSTVTATPSGAVQGTPSTVSGTGSFNISVGLNSGGAREIVTTVTYDSSHYASASRWQNVGSGVYTELTPRVISATGRIWLKCEVVASAQPYNWPLTTTNVKLNVTPTSDSSYVIDVGTVVFDPLASGVIVSGDSVDILLPARYSIVRGQTTQMGTIVPQNTTQNPSMVCTTDNGVTVSGISVVSANYTVEGFSPLL